MANRQFIASREDFSVSCFARRISLYAKIKIPRLAHWWTANRFHWWSEKRFKEFSHEIHAKFWSAIFGRLDIEKTSSEKKIYAIFIFSVYLNYQFNYLDTSRELFLGSDVWQSWNPNGQTEKRISTVGLVVISILKLLSPTSSELYFITLSAQFALLQRKFKLWTLRLYGRLERQRSCVVSSSEVWQNDNVLMKTKRDPRPWHWVAGKSRRFFLFQKKKKQK